MKLNSARLCLNCEEIYEPFYMKGISHGEGRWVNHCPSCASDCFTMLANYMSTGFVEGIKFKWKGKLKCLNT